MKLLAQSVVRPPPVRPSGMVMPAASRIPNIARSGSPALFPPHTGGVFEDTFQAATRGVQQRFMQFMPTPSLQQNPPSNK
ncbi:hypothetical protein SESBI_31094 [Sesbania bispinosa]|nr:hypothetical protein SESBI_31094 [Sesbania bispinosa]